MKRFLLQFSIFLFPAFICAQAPSGSVAHYLMDNNLSDLGGNSYNGTLNATTATTDRFGNTNKATSFIQGSSSGELPGALAAPANGTVATP
jgi:hypothetical protein